MRRLVLAAALSMMAPVAMAQMAPPGNGPAGAAYGQPGAPYGQPGAPYGQPGAPYGQPGAPMDPSMQRTTTAMSAPTPTAMHQGGENCGTPDEFKACPPLPRHALPYYPPNK